MYKEERMRSIPANNITPTKYSFFSSTNKPNSSAWIYHITFNEAMTNLKAKKRRVFGFFDLESNREMAPPEVLDQLNQEEQHNQV